MCGHCNPMSLLSLWSQSQQSIPTHMLTIDDNQRDIYDSRMCLYWQSGVTGSEIHLILECLTTSHIKLDLIQLLTNLLYDYPDHPPTNLSYPRRPPIYPSQKTLPHFVEVKLPCHPSLCLPTWKSLIWHDTKHPPYTKPLLLLKKIQKGMNKRISNH